MFIRIYRKFLNFKVEIFFFCVFKLILFFDIFDKINIIKNIYNMYL